MKNIIEIKPNGKIILEELNYIYNVIIKALHQTNGILHTFEEYHDFYIKAKFLYENSDLKNNIILYNSSIIEGLKNLGTNFLNEVDLFFLDGGGENPQGHPKQPIENYLADYNISENLQSFKYIEDKIKVGCHILLHDWSVEHGRGNFIKRYLKDTKNTNFEVVNIINGFNGLAHLVKVK